MKIGIVTTWFERGASYVSKAFKEALEYDSNNVVIYARGGEKFAKGDPKWDYEGITWGKRVPSLIPSFTDKKNFIEWLESENPKVVIFNEQRWFEPVLECRRRNIKVGSYIDYYTENTIPSFAIYDFIICNTKKHLSAFSWHKQSYYIPWGTNINLFSPVKTYLENKTVRVFFHSAGMNPYRKGTDLVILAFKRAVEKNDKKAKLIIHTQVNNLVDFFESNRSCYNSKRIKKVIDWLSARNYIEIECKTVSEPGLYFKGDIYLYPSRLDGLGLTVVEAISSGLPAIVPNDGPMNEFVIPSITGEICKVDDYISRSDGYYWPQNRIDMSDFIDKINYFLNMSANDLKDFKINTRKYAVENFDSNKNLKALNRIIYNSKRIPLEDNFVLSDYYNGVERFVSKYPFIFQLYKKLVR